MSPIPVQKLPADLACQPKNYCQCKTKEILLLEALMTKSDYGSGKSSDLIKALEKYLNVEKEIIQTIPENYEAIDGDGYAKKFASIHGCTTPSTPDAMHFFPTKGIYQLVECKYKIYPETQMFRSKAVFNNKCASKFDWCENHLSVDCKLGHTPNRIIIVTEEAKEMVKHNFRAYKIANDLPEGLYLILDTQELIAYLKNNS